MKSPVILPLEKNKVVLIAETFLAIEITQNEADNYVGKLSENENTTINTVEGKIIQYIHIDEITSKKEANEIDIATEINGEYTMHTLAMKNLQDRDKCIEAIYAHLAHNYTHTVGKQKLSDALLLPGICFIVVSVVGSLFAWFCQVVQEPLKQPKIVKAWVYYAYHICKSIGPTPPMILTGILLIVCLFFLGKQIFHRPMVIMLEKGKKSM